MTLMHEAFISQSGTVLAITYQLQKSRLVYVLGDLGGRLNSVFVPLATWKYHARAPSNRFPLKQVELIVPKLTSKSAQQIRLDVQVAS